MYNQDLCPAFAPIGTRARNCLNSCPIKDLQEPPVVGILRAKVVQVDLDRSTTRTQEPFDRAVADCSAGTIREVAGNASIRSAFSTRIRTYPGREEVMSGVSRTYLRT
jgi:hypothetical protein